MTAEKVCEIIYDLDGRRETVMIMCICSMGVTIFGAYIMPMTGQNHKNYGTGSSIEFAIADLIEKQKMIEVYDAEGNYSLSYPNRDRGQ